MLIPNSNRILPLEKSIAECKRKSKFACWKDFPRGLRNGKLNFFLAKWDFFFCFCYTLGLEYPAPAPDQLYGIRFSEFLWLSEKRRTDWKKKQFFTFSHRIFYAVLILKVTQGTHKKRNFGFLKNYVSTNLSSSSKKTWGGPGGHYRILQDRNARECGTISSGVDLFDSFCVKLGQCNKKFLFFPQNLLIPGNYWKPVRIYNEKRGKGSRYFA